MARLVASGMVGIFLAGWILAALPARADSDETRITDLEVEIDDQLVYVSFEIRELFDEKMELRIQSGLPTDLVFIIQLVRRRRGWFDKSVDTARLEASVVYNAVTREYKISYTLDGNLIQTPVVNEVEAMRKAMTEFVRIPVFLLKDRTGEVLRVRVKAELGTRTILFFIPTTRTTDWGESDRFEVGPNGELEAVDGDDE